jgi:hypothetical protein
MRFLILVTIQTAVIPILFSVWKFVTPKAPRIAAGITAVVCIAYMVVTKLIGQVPMSLVMWLLCILISIRIVHQYLKNNTSDSWRLWALLACLSSTVIYARLIYPKMLPWLGGPPRATVVILCEKSCSIDDKPMRLIDETDDGYYLVPYDDPTPYSTFIARSNVKEARFIASPWLLRESPSLSIK